MDFLRRVDRWVTNRMFGLTPVGTWTYSDEVALFNEFLFLDTFRSELQQLLESHDLPASMCQEDKLWYDFLAQYAGVIEDGSLCLASDKAGEVTAVDRVIFTKGPALPDGHHVPFVIHWEIALKDGRRVKASFNTVESQYAQMTMHSREVS